MPPEEKRFRFFLLQAFSLPPASKYLVRPMGGPKEKTLMNFPDVAHLLEDVDWELHPGALAPHGDWPVETREEFCLAAASRLPIVREACASGKYNGIILLGGGDPGFMESREIGRRHGIPVTACGNAQMHAAAMLGNRFSILDISEVHNMRMRDLVVQYEFSARCASIRNIHFPMPRPTRTGERSIVGEREKAQRGETSDMLETSVREALSAVEDDGAEVIILGCSAAYWLQPFLQKRLNSLGWEIPVLEGYRCAIEQAKMLANLGLDASGLAFPSDHPKKWRRKKTI